jgi:chromosome segregation and condensation protein ScpB
LGTVPEASELIEKIIKDELTRELGKSSLETLTIILYKSPIAKPEIDYIRGVNSNYILRNLLVRGLVEKISNPKDQNEWNGQIKDMIDSLPDDTLISIYDCHI